MTSNFHWYLFSAMLLALTAIGCDSSVAPGDQLYALKNPTRTWKTPGGDSANEKRPNDSEHSQEEDAVATSEPPIAVYPPQLMAERVRPDQSAETSVLISSQHWTRFELADLSADLDGLTWQVKPADPTMLKQINALSGWLLTAKFPAGLPEGRVTESSLHLTVNPTSSQDQPRPLDIPLRAKVLRRLAVYGEGIDETGTLSFGVQPIGIKHRRRLIVKVHDELPDLPVKNITTQPEFVTATLSAYDQADPSGHFYYLDVELPENAPEYVSRGQQLGNIELTFDHPRIKTLTLNVDFILHGRARQALAAWSDAR